MSSSRDKCTDEGFIQGRGYLNSMRHGCERLILANHDNVDGSLALHYAQECNSTSKDIESGSGLMGFSHMVLFFLPQAQTHYGEPSS